MATVQCLGWREKRGGGLDLRDIVIRVFALRGARNGYSGAAVGFSQRVISFHRSLAGLFGLGRRDHEGGAKQA